MERVLQAVSAHIPAFRTVAIGLKLAPTNLDIRNTAGSALDQVLIGNVYEGLVARNSENKVVPALAKSWGLVSSITTVSLFGALTDLKFFSASASWYCLLSSSLLWHPWARKADQTQSSGAADTVAIGLKLAPTNLDSLLSWIPQWLVACGLAARAS